MACGTQWVRTVGLGQVPAHELQAALQELTAEVFAACEARFPGSQQYRHRIERDRGVVEGHRLHVERRGFRGVVAVQWYSRSHSYRHAREGGLEVRIGGRARVEQVVTTTRRTEVDPHVHGRVLGLGLAAVLGLAGVQTVRLVMAYPSWQPAMDVIGVALAVMAIFAACWLLRLAIIGRWWRQIGVSRATMPSDAASDLGRWRDLGIDVDRIQAPSGHAQA